MAKHINSITNENEPFFVQTGERTEHFATCGAAQLFIKTHCNLHGIRGNNTECLVRTNAIR